MIASDPDVWLALLPDCAPIYCLGCDQEGHRVQATELWFYIPDEALRPVCEDHGVHASEIEDAELVAVAEVAW